MSEISGHIVAISHVFYLSGHKGFWIQVLEKDGKESKNVLIDVENHQLKKVFKDVQLHPELYFGRRVVISDTKRNSMAMSSGPVRVYKIVEKSNMEVVSSSKPSPLMKTILGTLFLYPVRLEQGILRSYLRMSWCWTWD